MTALRDTCRHELWSKNPPKKVGRKSTSRKLSCISIQSFWGPIGPSKSLLGGATHGERRVLPCDGAPIEDDHVSVEESREEVETRSGPIRYKLHHQAAYTEEGSNLHVFLDFLGRLQPLITAPENSQIQAILCQNEARGGT